MLIAPAALPLAEALSIARQIAEALEAARMGQDIWMLPLDGRREARPWLQTPANDGMARVSPDGRWMSYVSDESGVNEERRPPGAP